MSQDPIVSAAKRVFKVTLIAKIEGVDILLGMTTLEDQILSDRVIYYIYSTLEEFGMVDFTEDLTIFNLKKQVQI